MIALLLAVAGLARADYCFPNTCTPTATATQTNTFVSTQTFTKTATPTNTQTNTPTTAPTLFSVGGQITSVAGMAAAGIGGGFVVASGTVTAATTAVASVCAVATAVVVAGSYRVNATVNVTAWTTPASFNVQVTYTDDNGSAQTSNIAMKPTTGTLPTGGNITATGVWEGQSNPINCNSAAITVKTAGTFTGSPTYNVYGSIERLR